MRLLPMSEWHAADALVSPADTDIAVAQPTTEEDGDGELGASTMLFGASIRWLSLAFVCYFAGLWRAIGFHSLLRTLV